MPNPSKPLEQKRLEGNLGKRALPTTKGYVPAITQEQATLKPHPALLMALQHGARWLAITDAPTLALLNDNYYERDEIAAEIAAGTGKRSDKRAIDKQIMQLLSVLGFDPTTRSRLGLVEVQAASSLERLRQNSK